MIGEKPPCTHAQLGRLQGPGSSGGFAARLRQAVGPVCALTPPLLCMVFSAHTHTRAAHVYKHCSASATSVSSGELTHGTSFYPCNSSQGLQRCRCWANSSAIGSRVQTACFGYWSGVEWLAYLEWIVQLLTDSWGPRVHACTAIYMWIALLPVAQHSSELSPDQGVCVIFVCTPHTHAPDMRSFLDKPRPLS